MPRLIKEYIFFSIRKKALSAFLVVLAVMAVTMGAITPKAVATTNMDPNTALITSQESYDTSHRGRAPEPSTMVLMASGALAAVVRFTRRRFAEFKRGFDVIVAVIGLIVSAPVLLLAVIAIKTMSPGPVLFRQRRVGRYGEVFEIFKLRTMIVDAEKQTGPVWASQNDPRVTPIGKFLRKSRVDEIPQLVNVLRGEMSIIGPRPERPEIIPSLAKEIGEYTKRLRVRPGITGLAQIKQSYDANIKDVRRKVKFDILYIKRMCFLTDLRIVFGTILVMATGRGAR
jgi:lipopolysaccharide/colanic/teichoic acid biosynthesis glycosyltransferase